MRLECSTVSLFLFRLGVEAAMAPLGEQELYHMNSLVPLNGMSLLHMNGHLAGAAAAAVVKRDPPVHQPPPQIAMEAPKPAPQVAAAGGGQDTQNGDSSPGAGGRSSSPQANSSSAQIDTSANKLFVGGLSWQTSTEKLRTYFGMFGTVTDVLIMKDPITQVIKYLHLAESIPPGNITLLCIKI